MPSESDQIPDAPAAAPISSAEALAVLRGTYPQFAPGEVWLVGAGPGDPGLLTLDAVAALAQADVVVYDALVDPRVLALVRTDAELQFAGKRAGKPSIAQDAICRQLLGHARRGLRVLRLKGGDPFVFGRGGEELLVLAAAGVSFRIIPGITSGLSGLASAWIPATMRGVNQAVILATGHGADDEGGVDWPALAGTRQPIVLYMALRKIEPISLALMHGGLPAATPCAVIVSATLAQQRVLVTTLERVAAEARDAKLASPAIIVIGEIVLTRRRIIEALAAAAQSTATAPASDPSTPHEVSTCAS